MADKLAVVSAPHLTKTYKIANAAAKTKGQPEIQQTFLVFPFDSYLASEAEAVYVYAAPMVRATASGANADIASVNFVAGQLVYWDAVASKVTNVSAGNTKIGRCLESKNLSGGVVAGDTLLFELDSGA
jgi:hypothetical protein